MEIAFMSASMLDRSWEAALDAAVSRDVSLIEACAGGHIPKRHFDPVELASSPDALARFTASLEERGLRLCAFSCHGNPLDPNLVEAERIHADFVATCEVAGRLGVPHVSLLAGCPAGGPNDSVPNWIVKSTLPHCREPYEWQWKERVIPYWRDAVKVAESNGVKLCIEPHSADVVYNFKTFARLREAVGETIGMNYDPSHMWWQGVDPLVFIQHAGEWILTCHIKDAFLSEYEVALHGCVSSEDYDDWDRRPWAFRTAGYGHSELFWSQFVIALRNVGYAGALSIECEDPFMTPDDTLHKTVELLRRVLPADARPPVNWAAVAIGA